MDDRRGEWERGVDENLASLNAGQRVWEREQKAIRKAIADQDALLRGDTGKETDGLIARLHQQENEIRLIRAVLFKDALGTGGLVEDVKAIRDGREDRRANWGDITKIIVAIITSGTLGLFWRDIHAVLARKPTDPLSKMIENAKRPKVRHRYVDFREEPEEPDAQD